MLAVMDCSTESLREKIVTTRIMLDTKLICTYIIQAHTSYVQVEHTLYYYVLFMIIVQVLMICNPL